MYKLGTLKDLEGKYKNREFIVLGAGSTIKEFKSEIEAFIKDKNLISIGINNVSTQIVPDLHLWTNNKRLKRFCRSIKPQSELLLGSNIKVTTTEYVEEVIGNFAFFRIDYIDNFGYVGQDPERGILKGEFRTAGLLAIRIACYLGSKTVYVAGMDGYTLNYNGDQHCYGFGPTDSQDEKYCQEKDEIVKKQLDKFYWAHMNVKIITPTVFEEFYDKDILCKY